MEGDELKEYLHNCLQLESGIYECKEQIKEIEKTLSVSESFNNYYSRAINRIKTGGTSGQVTEAIKTLQGNCLTLSKKPTIDSVGFIQRPKPKKDEHKKVDRYTYVDKTNEKTAGQWRSLAPWMLIGFPLIAFGGIALNSVGAAICGFALLILFIVGWATSTKKLKSEESRYNEAVMNAEAENAEIDKRNAAYEEQVQREYNLTLSQINSSVDEANKQIKIENCNIDVAIEELHSAKDRIYNAEKQMEDKLKEQYDKGIVFEKYRNFIAIASFYEYLASSRCSKLEGPDGAYNLFEQELRQNVIIGQLNVIITKLDEIKQNQYCMYTELTKISSSLEETNRSINNITNSVSNIDNTTQYVAAVDNEIGNMMGVIQKDLSTVKGVAVAQFLLK